MMTPEQREEFRRTMQDAMRRGVLVRAKEPEQTQASQREREAREREQNRIRQQRWRERHGRSA